jgi:hypothetical protein
LAWPIALLIRAWLLAQYSNRNAMEETNENKSRFPIRPLQPACLRGFASLRRWRIARDAQFRGIDKIERDHNYGSSLPRTDVSA